MPITACIRLYQRWVSPCLPGCCRFYPSCSEYALQALEHYGCWRGGWLALRRLACCHPWHPGGFDPVIKDAPRSSLSSYARDNSPYGK